MLGLEKKLGMRTEAIEIKPKVVGLRSIRSLLSDLLRERQPF
jgi:hypothetical protein